MKVIEVENRDFPQLWLRLCQNDVTRYPSGTPLVVEYSKAYARGAEFIDRSFIVEVNSELVLGVQIALLKRNSKFVEISAFGQPILYLESIHSTAYQIKRANMLLKAKLTGILNEAPGAAIVYVDFLVNGGLSFLGQYFLDNGASARPYFTQILSILPCAEDLKSGVRKSYKSLINWGLKNLVIRIIDRQTITEAEMERFRKLHIQESGRETRSTRTWEIQYEQVRNGESFIVLGELSGELVTAAYFHHSDRYCIYGVSASIRALFNKPLSHCIIWMAILQAKRIGCSVFEFGEQLFPAQGMPSVKELGISVFKRGFGGETVVRLMVVREFKDSVDRPFGNLAVESNNDNE